MAQRKIGTNELDEAVDRVRDARAELARLHAELARCSAAASMAATHSEALEQLRAQRHELMTEAFADDITADTGEVDARIAQAETAHAEAISAAAVARDAVVVLEARIAAQRDLLGPLLTEWQTTAREAMLAALDAAEERFARAVDALGSPVAELCALAQVWREVTGGALPANGREAMRESLQGIPALRVVWSHSALKDPAISERYSPESYEGAARFAPEWFTAEGFGVRETATLREQLHIGEVQV